MAFYDATQNRTGIRRGSGYTPPDVTPIRPPEYAETPVPQFIDWDGLYRRSAPQAYRGEDGRTTIVHDFLVDIGNGVRNATETIGDIGSAPVNAGKSFLDRVDENIDDTQTTLRIVGVGAVIAAVVVGAVILTKE